jgi:hypothetical protein
MLVSGPPGLDIYALHASFDLYIAAKGRNRQLHRSRRQHGIIVLIEELHV